MTIFPSDPGERVKVMLPALSAETKALALLNLDANTPLKGRPFRRKLSESLGTPYNLPGKTTLEAYCDQVFVPAGIVEKRAEGFVLTEEGVNYALPLAAFTLNWSYVNRMSINCVLGMSSTRGETRAPLNRVNLLEVLTEKGEITEAQLAREVDLVDNGIGMHLKVLRKLGFLLFDSIGKNDEKTGLFTYKFLPTEKTVINSVCRRPNLTVRVYNTLKEIGEGDRNLIARKLGLKPKEISCILAGLAKQGHAIQNGKWELGKRYSRILITDKGRRFVQTYISPLRDALTGGKQLEEMKKLLSTLQEDNELYRAIARLGIDYYAAHSPNMNRKSRAIQHRQIRTIIVTHGPLTAEQVATKMGLSKNRAGEYLREMACSNILRKTEKPSGEVLFGLA